MTSVHQQMARNLVLNLIEERSPTSESLSEKVDAVMQMMAVLHPDATVDRGDLIRELETIFDVFQDESVALADDTDHLPWLEERSAAVDWRFWNRYLRYVRERDGLPPNVLDRLDLSTRRVLGRLEDPARPGPWDRRGLVVGQVQSGKTSNYTGLICKAADAGYRFILVLAGIHNSLRSQTQLRLDTGLLGFDTQLRQSVEANDDGFAGVALGVGRLPGAEAMWACSLTNSSESGDFRKRSANNVSFNLQIAQPGPVLLVVKKNASILRNLAEWVIASIATGDPPRVRHLPMLMIDDEADNASINTNPVRDAAGEPDPDYDVTRVNGAIRTLLNLFDHAAYIGYTATPFANIYIDDVGSDTSPFGRDLFPRSFIEYLRPPSNYFGPTRLFGLDDGPPLPLHREVDDHTDWLPERHRAHHVPAPTDFPPSLRRALLSFILARAIRLVRGQTGQHNSMLIHVSRFQNVQAVVRRQVEEELEAIRAAVRFGDGDGPSIRDELRLLWETDFVDTTGAFDDEELPPPSWPAVDAQLEEAVTPITVKTINGSAADALEYFEHRNTGLNVVAIGGDKLSRGLTLEGLTVSYYLRASRTFDTLMQMGRWFGYRSGYEDVCRLYTTEHLWGCYREVTAANEELIAEFETMAALGLSPEDYGLKVRNTIQGMLVTSANKMRSATNLRLGFAGTLAESVVLYCRKAEADANFTTLERLVTALGSPDDVSDSGNMIWHGARPSTVAGSFFEPYYSPPGAWKVNAQMIARYIRDCQRIGELTDWTVVLVSNSNTTERAVVGGLEVGLTKRTSLPNSRITTDGTYSIRRILNPPDEWTDLGGDEVQALTDAAIERWRETPGDRREPTRPSGEDIRRHRDKSRALLIIYPLTPVGSPAGGASGSVELSDRPLVGFAVSFPTSETAGTVEYTANLRYLRELFSDPEDDE